METSLQHILLPSDVQIDHSNPTGVPSQHQLSISPQQVSDHQHLGHSDAIAGGNAASRKRQQPRVKAKYPRKRAVQACRTCRLRRTKCDNERPSCGSCVGLGIECIYQAGDPSTFDPASLAILERLDSLEELLRGSKSDSFSPNQAPGDPSPISLPKNLDSPALERTADSIPCYINIEAVLSWPVFEDQDFERRLDLRALLQADKGNLGQPALSSSADFELCDGAQLLQQFLDNVHIFNPVLEESKVKEYMRHARFNGLGWDAQSCLLLLIYALGSIAAPYEKTPLATSSMFRESSDFRQAESFFFAAQKRMGMLLCGSGVIEAQCFFLAGVYLMATLRPIEAWKMFVQALACCQGFYNPRRTYDNSHEEEKQFQESIYWTCFKSELELRLELNISEKSAWDLTYPAFFPSPPEGLKSQGEAVWYFYLAEIALRRLGNRILNYVYRYESSSSTMPSTSTSTSTSVSVSASSATASSNNADIEDAIPNFEDQADGWLRSLPPALKFDAAATSPMAKNSDHAALKFILHGHLLDCYEMMYWPFLVDAVHGRLRHSPSNPTGSTTSTSTSTSTSASITLSEAFARKGLLVCVQRIQINESGFYHRHHGTWLMLRSCTRSALVLLGAARSPSLSVLLPQGWETAVWKVMDMLRFWRDESSDARDRLGVVEQLMKGVTGGAVMPL